jgi:hypothetical protein
VQFGRGLLTFQRIFFDPEIRSVYVSPKRRSTSTGLHGITIQTVLFIATAVRMSDRTQRETLLRSVETGSGTHSASCPVGIGSWPWR